jgi:hypothetical protein
MLLEKAPIQLSKRPKTYQAAVAIMVTYTTILLACALAVVYSSDAAPRCMYPQPPLFRTPILSFSSLQELLPPLA